MREEPAPSGYPVLLLGTEDDFLRKNPFLTQVWKHPFVPNLFDASHSEVLFVNTNFIQQNLKP